MGTPEFSVPALDRIIKDGHVIAAVYTQPPRPAGRGKKDRISPVQSFALSAGLDVRHPDSLKTDEVQKGFEALNADVAVVVAYGLLLPQAVLDMPKYGCLNIHASLLPRWRGAAPHPGGLGRTYPGHAKSEDTFWPHSQRRLVPSLLRLMRSLKSC